MQRMDADGASFGSPKWKCQRWSNPTQMVRNGTFSIFLRITSRGLQAVKPYLNHWFPGFSSHSAQAPKVLCFLGQDGPHWWPISSPKWEYIYGKISRTTQTSAQRWPFGLLATGGQHHFLLEVSSIFYKISLFAFLKKTSPWENLPKGQQLSFYKHIATFQESIAEVFHSPIENIWTYIMGHDPKTILLPIDMAPFILHKCS